MFQQKVLRNKKWVLTWLVLLLALFLLRSQTYVVSFDGLVKGVGPAAVWEFVMDFNNMKRLNPTITNFSIISDDKPAINLDWQYQVKYSEVLHQLPFIQNEAIAVYKFKTISKDEYEILSDHKTCFFWGTYCVRASSKFLFQKSKRGKSDTYCLEEVFYECPRIMSRFCYNEVIFQRKSIFKNLDKLLSLK